LNIVKKQFSKPIQARTNPLSSFLLRKTEKKTLLGVVHRTAGSFTVLCASHNSRHEITVEDRIKKDNESSTMAR